MNFNIPNPPPESLPPKVEVGNVYVSKNTYKTVAWVVLGISENGCHMVGINREGEITTTQSYNIYVMERRKLVGRCDLSDLTFDIMPISDPDA